MVWYGDGAGGWGYALMIVSMFLFWGLVIGGVMALVRSAASTPEGTGTSPHAPSSAEQVLAERLARREIDEQEHRRLLDVLRTTTSPAGRR